MKFLRNPEIKKCLFLQLLVCFIFAGIGFYFDTICGVIILFLLFSPENVTGRWNP